MNLNKLITILISLLVLVSCGSPGEVTTSAEGITYSYFEIEGMPCIYVMQNPGANFATGGPTCDWSKWKGNDEPQ